MVLVAVHNSDITGFIATTHLGVIELPDRSLHVVIGLIFDDGIVATKDTVSHFTRLSHEVLQILLVETTKKSDLPATATRKMINLNAIRSSVWRLSFLLLSFPNYLLSSRKLDADLVSHKYLSVNGIQSILCIIDVIKLHKGIDRPLGPILHRYVDNLAILPRDSNTQITFENRLSRSWLRTPYVRFPTNNRAAMDNGESC